MDEVAPTRTESAPAPTQRAPALMGPSSPVKHLNCTVAAGGAKNRPVQDFIARYPWATVPGACCYCRLELLGLGELSVPLHAGEREKRESRRTSSGFLRNPSTLLAPHTSIVAIDSINRARANHVLHIGGRGQGAGQLGRAINPQRGRPFLFIQQSRAFQSSSHLSSRSLALLRPPSCLTASSTLQSSQVLHSLSLSPQPSVLFTSLHFVTCKMKMTVSTAAAESPSRSGFRLREKLGKLHVFSVDRTHRWPVQGWSSGDESPLELDEQFVAEEGARAFALDKESRWPLQGWCQPHKPYNNSTPDVHRSGPSVPSRWPQGF